MTTPEFADTQNSPSFFPLSYSTTKSASEKQTSSSTPISNQTQHPQKASLQSAGSLPKSSSAFSQEVSSVSTTSNIPLLSLNMSNQHSSSPISSGTDTLSNKTLPISTPPKLTLTDSELIDSTHISKNTISTAYSSSQNFEINNEGHKTAYDLSSSLSKPASSSYSLANSDTDLSSSSKQSSSNQNETSTTINQKVIDKQSLDYIIRSSIAGGLAGTSAKTLIAPLDRVKILFQTSNPEFKKFTGSWFGFYRAGKEIYNTQGLLGLFQGHSATLLRIFPYAATKFVMYEQVRTFLIPSKEKETSVRRFLAGSISGVSSVFVTYPLDLLRVRLAFETKALQAPTVHGEFKPTFQQHKNHYDYKGGKLIQTIVRIYGEDSAKTPDPVSKASIATAGKPLQPQGPVDRSSIRGIFNGISNFYRGFTPTIAGMIPYAGVSFWAHDLFHDIFRSSYLAPYAVMDVMPPEEITQLEELSKENRNLYKAHRQPLNSWAQLTAGGLAGMAAQTASYPLEVVRRRIQVSGVTGESIGMLKTCSVIYQTAGIRGFFVGLSIGYIKVVPMFACSFFVYERLKSLLRI